MASGSESHPCTGVWGQLSSVPLRFLGVSLLSLGYPKDGCSCDLID